MSKYFFVIFEVHHTVSRYNVCLEKYMDLSLRLSNGTTSEDIKPMKKTRKSGSQFFLIILSHTPQYSKIQNWPQPCFCKGFTYFHVFLILEAPYIEPL